MYSTQETLIAADDGTNLYTRRFGTGDRAVVLCDGVLCDGFVYRYLWQDLVSLVEACGGPWGAVDAIPGSVVHWNYRGHGRSGSPSDGASLGVADHALDLARVCRALQLRSVVLVGHSYGGSVVLEAVRQWGTSEANCPMRAAGMVLMGATSGSVTKQFRRGVSLTSVIPHLRQATEGSPRIARAVWSRLPASLASRIAVLSGEVNRSNLQERDIQPYFDHLRRLSPALSVRMLEEASSYSAENALPGLNVPAMVIAGGRDTFIPAEESRRLADALPQGHFHEVPSATHVYPLEYPKHLHELMKKFLARAAW